jgi:Universal stress protein family
MICSVQYERAVLVPLEGSASDPATLALAGAVAVRLGGPLVLMRVVRPSLPPLFRGPLSLEGQDCSDAEMIAETARLVREADEELCSLKDSLSDVRVERVLLVSANPGRRIVTWLEEHPVALVVTVRDSRRGLLENGIYRQIAESGLATMLPLDLSGPGERRGAPRRRLPSSRRTSHCLRLRQWPRV